MLHSCLSDIVKSELGSLFWKVLNVIFLHPFETQHPGRDFKKRSQRKVVCVIVCSHNLFIMKVLFSCIPTF